jgi:RNA polymerase sigma factor (sigma-70 family)
LAAVPSIGRASLVEPRSVAPEAIATHGLYERHAAKIHSYCLHQLGSREEAEDAVQTTFMNAFRALGKGVVPEAEAAWLFKIAENVCLSRRRSSWRRNRIESPADFEVIEEIVPGPNRQRDELIGIEDALAAMPGQQRRAILLREWQGLSYREISTELELSQSAVETLIFRARRSLAQGLTEPERVKPHTQRRRLLRTLHLGDLPALFGAVKSLLAGTAALKATAAAVVVTAAAGTVVTVTASDAEAPRKPALAVSALPPLPPAVPVALASSAPPAAPALVERTPVAPRAKPAPGIEKKNIEKKSIEKSDARPVERKAARVEQRAEQKAVRVEARTERKAARLEGQAEQKMARAERRAELKAALVERRAERQAKIVQRKADRAELRAQQQAAKAERRTQRPTERVEPQAERAQRGTEGKPDPMSQ